MNQTNGDSTEIMITGLSVEKVNEKANKEEEKKGIYTLKVIDGGKTSMQDVMVLTTAKVGRLKENAIETPEGNIIEFKGAKEVEQNRQERVASIEKYRKIKAEKAKKSEKDEDSRVG